VAADSKQRTTDNVKPRLSRGRVKIAAFVGVFDFLLWRDLAIEAEQLGFESFWVPEHLVLPLGMSGRPGVATDRGDSPDDHPFVPPHLPLADPLVALADVAARTSVMRLGTGVYVPGLRHPFASARALMTLDRLSCGRLDVGVGVGWLRAEWEAAEVEFAGRGSRLDEILEIWRRLWSEHTVSHEGRWYRFGDVCFEPKPVQPGGPPIHVGGMSAPARRRAARLGDGWFTLPSPDLAVLRDAVEQMHDERVNSQRPFEVTVSVNDATEIDAYAASGLVDRVVVAYSRDPTVCAQQMRLAATIVGA
jgi:probable F420-dependent oxidoreductase